MVKLSCGSFVPGNLGSMVTLANVSPSIFEVSTVYLLSPLVKLALLSMIC